MNFVVEDGPAFADLTASLLDRFRGGSAFPRQVQSSDAGVAFLRAAAVHDDRFWEGGKPGLVAVDHHFFFNWAGGCCLLGGVMTMVLHSSRFLCGQ